MLRAHHGMCLAFFIGEGYSSSFVENMKKQKTFLDTEDPAIEIVCEADSICLGCPNNQEGVCTSIGKVQTYDSLVLAYCKLENHSQLKWSTYQKIVRNNILDAHKREAICGDCSWNSLCRKIEK